MYKRQHFKDGVIYLQLNGYNINESIVRYLETKILKKKKGTDLNNQPENQGIYINFNFLSNFSIHYKIKKFNK